VCVFLTRMTNLPATRAVDWYTDHLEFFWLTKEGMWKKSRDLKFPTVDGQVIWRTGMGQHYYEIAIDWTREGRLPSQPV